MASPSPNGVILASLKASTENLGDYIQILACLRLLERLDLRPSIYLDRDTELASATALESCSGRVVLPLNGWFKRTVGTDPQWPPHDRIIPVFVGFHVRPRQCPALLEQRSIDYMKAHGPVGCRDLFTMRALGERGVSTYLSHCLSLTFARRAPDQVGDKVVVASRDREILDVLPPEYRNDHVYVNHYGVKDGFSAYLAKAQDVLEFYRARAHLVVTTFLHCALPCIAMGIPVVVFLPRPQDDLQKASDQERFSGLMQIAPVHRFGNTARVDWSPRPLEVEELKERIVLNFQNRVAAALRSAGRRDHGDDSLAFSGRPVMAAQLHDAGPVGVNRESSCMSAEGTAINPALSLEGAIDGDDFGPDRVRGGKSSHRGEVEVLRNSLSAVMVEHHEQSKKLASLTADNARQSEDITVLTAQNIQLSRDLAALDLERDAWATAHGEAAARCAAAEAERDDLRSKSIELEKRLIDIESSTSWVATRKLREFLTRHPKLRRVVTTMRRALARRGGAV